MNRVDSIETARTAATSALREIARITDEALLPALAAASELEIHARRYAKYAEQTRSIEGTEAYLTKADKCNAAAAEIRAEVADLSDVYRAVRWDRFNFVPGGHVHRETCSTLRMTTALFALPEYSGASDEEIVEAAGSRACTVCFSDAPIDPRRASIIRYAVEEDEARAAEAAEREAKRKAAADAAIRHEDGEVAFKSRRAAENALSREIGDYVYFASYSKGYTHPGTGEFVPNHETAEEYWAEREDRLIARSRRAARAMVELLKANGIPAEEVDAIAAKKFAAKVKDATKHGLILPEGFAL